MPLVKVIGKGHYGGTRATFRAGADDEALELGKAVNQNRMLRFNCLTGTSSTASLERLL